MPITLGTNLEKTGNKLSAKYDDMFSKLNVAYAWVNGDVVVYTTKTQDVGDNIYSDTDLTILTTITAVTSTTITGGGITFTRDSTEDSSFTGIPPKTQSETLTIADMLRITNPNT